MNTRPFGDGNSGGDSLARLDSSNGEWGAADPFGNLETREVKRLRTFPWVMFSIRSAYYLRSNII